MPFKYQYFNSERSQSLKVVNRNELLDEKVVHMIISRSEKAEKYRSAVVSIKEAINRHWQELEELRKNKEMEERDTANHLKISIKKVEHYFSADVKLLGIRISVLLISTNNYVIPIFIVRYHLASGKLRQNWQ